MFGTDENGIDVKTLIVMIIIVFVVALGTSYFVLQYFTTEAGEAEEDLQELGPNYKLGDFVVNLQGARRQFLRLNIVLEVENEEVISEIEDKMPRVEDIVVTTLRAQKIEQIEEPGTPTLKQNLKIELNQILTSGDVRDVWFTEFLVQ